MVLNLNVNEEYSINEGAHLECNTYREFDYYNAVPYKQSYRGHINRAYNEDVNDISELFRGRYRWADW